MGLGFRVPLLVVSPYAEARIHLPRHPRVQRLPRLHRRESSACPSLGSRDVLADDFSDCFDYTQLPQPLIKINALHTPQYLINEKLTAPPEDDD